MTKKYADNIPAPQEIFGIAYHIFIKEEHAKVDGTDALAICKFYDKMQFVERFVDTVNRVQQQYIVEEASQAQDSTIQ